MLDWNEAQWPPSPRVIHALEDFIGKQYLNYYPDTSARDLHQALAEYVGLSVDYILSFGGSDSALEYLCRAYIDEDDEVVFYAPTYDNTRVYIESVGGHVRYAIASNPFEPDIHCLLDSVTPKTKMVYIGSPNNPTGTVWDIDLIADLLRAEPNILFVLDEAYYEFVSKTSSPLVRSYRNLVVTRSFSKAFGLANMRLGYLVGCPEILSFVNKIRVGKNLGMMQQIAGVHALSDLSYMKHYVGLCRKGQDYICNELKLKGWATINTPANFFLIEVKDPANVQAKLATRNIFVRSRPQLMPSRSFVRVTSGPAEFMERFLDAWLKSDF